MGTGSEVGLPHQAGEGRHPKTVGQAPPYGQRPNEQKTHAS